MKTLSGFSDQPYGANGDETFDEDLTEKTAQTILQILRNDSNSLTTPDKHYLKHALDTSPLPAFGLSSDELEELVNLLI